MTQVAFESKLWVEIAGVFALDRLLVPHWRVEVADVGRYLLARLLLRCGQV
jgi:hypothetical protein